MRAEKQIGVLLIAGATGVLIPYIFLTINFEYPNILRQDEGVILTKFHEGGSSLIFTWWAFAILGLPLLIAYIRIGQLLEKKFSFIRWVTVIGIISGVAQIIGLLRWVFVVPVLADAYVRTIDLAKKEAIVIAFKAIHQLGGVLLGEYIGQFFTIIWTAVISYAIGKLGLFPKWVTWLGFTASFIYLLAQADLFATVIPGFPVWKLAGLTGSTLWLIWLIVVGMMFWKAEIDNDVNLVVHSL